MTILTRSSRLIFDKQKAVTEEEGGGGEPALFVSTQLLIAPLKSLGLVDG